MKSPQQETSPQSPLPLARVARRPPGPAPAFVTPPLVSPPESGSDNSSRWRSQFMTPEAGGSSMTLFRAYQARFARQDF